jgi:NitT/TauT family transport system permease protein
VLLAEVRVLERALTPLLVALQVIPKVTIIPLLLLWFGFGSGSKVVIAAVFAYFPITMGTLAGLKGAELGHRDLAAVLQARRGQRLWTIELPGALPSILTGMEVGIVLATIGAVVAEYLAGDEGLGWLALRSLNGVRVDELFGVIVLLSLLGFVLYAVVSVLRRVLVPWHPSVRRLDLG